MPGPREPRRRPRRPRFPLRLGTSLRGGCSSGKLGSVRHPGEACGGIALDTHTQLHPGPSREPRSLAGPRACRGRDPGQYLGELAVDAGLGEGERKGDDTLCLQDLTETQRALSDTITAAYASAEDELSRRLLRAAAIMVPRGLGDADAVRGSVRLAAQELGLGSDRFLERWGRKMDERGDFRDMAICEAYLAFLWSDGDVDAFHKVSSLRRLCRCCGGVRPGRQDSFAAAAGVVSRSSVRGLGEPHLQ